MGFAVDAGHVQIALKAPLRIALKAPHTRIALKAPQRLQECEIALKTSHGPQERRTSPRGTLPLQALLMARYGHVRWLQGVISRPCGSAMRSQGVMQCDLCLQALACARRAKRAAAPCSRRGRGYVLIASRIRWRFPESNTMTKAQGDAVIGLLLAIFGTAVDSTIIAFIAYVLAAVYWLISGFNRNA